MVFYLTGDKNKQWTDHGRDFNDMKDIFALAKMEWKASEEEKTTAMHFKTIIEDIVQIIYCK